MICLLMTFSNIIRILLFFSRGVMMAYLKDVGKIEVCIDCDIMD